MPSASRLLEDICTLIHRLYRRFATIYVGCWALTSRLVLLIKRVCVRCKADKDGQICRSWRGFRVCSPCPRRRPKGTVCDAALQQRRSSCWGVQVTYWCRRWTEVHRCRLPGVYIASGEVARALDSRPSTSSALVVLRPRLGASGQDERCKSDYKRQLLQPAPFEVSRARPPIHALVQSMAEGTKKMRGTVMATLMSCLTRPFR